MLKPSYEVMLGQKTYKPGLESPVVSIRISLSMDIPADSFEIILGATDDTMMIKEKDPVSIKLGYDGDLKQVITGTVQTVSPMINHVRVIGLNQITNLLESRVSLVFEHQPAGDIVQNLANTCKINPGIVESGVNFPYYVVDDGRSVYHHIKELATLCGCDVYLSNEDKLNFIPYSGNSPYTVEYGVNIISANLDEQNPRVGTVIVKGESPSSFEGSDTYHWLTKKAVEGIEGKGNEQIKVVSALKDTQAAKTVAKSIHKERSRGTEGTVETVGAAEIKLGDSLEVKKMPNKALNGRFQVRAVEHYLSKRRGFTTTVRWRE